MLNRGISNTGSTMKIGKKGVLKGSNNGGKSFAKGNRG